MPDAEHFDDVALKHRDRLTRYMEDAVDAADDEAEGRAVGTVFPVSKSCEQVRAVPATPTRVQPERRGKTVKLNLTDSEMKDIRALADKGKTSISGWLRALVIKEAGVEWDR